MSEEPRTEKQIVLDAMLQTMHKIRMDDKKFIKWLTELDVAFLRSLHKDFKKLEAEQEYRSQVRAFIAKLWDSTTLK
jgi:hypothetical protein